MPLQLLHGMQQHSFCVGLDCSSCSGITCSLIALLLQLSAVHASCMSTAGSIELCDAAAETLMLCNVLTRCIVLLGCAGRKNPGLSPQHLTGNAASLHKINTAAAVKNSTYTSH
jgi:hypothetical protein